jgi:predicted GNAT family acetyltransferase
VPEPAVIVEPLPDARAFLATVGPYLERREAEHNLLFGIAGNLIKDPARRMTAPPFFAAIRRGGGGGNGEVVGGALMTPPFNIVLSCIDDEAAWSALLDHLVAERVRIPGVTAPAELARAFCEAYAARHGLEAERTMAERIYRLEHVTPPVGVPGTMRLGTTADRDLLVDWADAFLAEALDRRDPEEPAELVDSALRSGTRLFYLWEHEGRPVSMAGVTGPTPHGIRVGPVYTPPADRGHGFASAVTAAASQEQLDQGRSFVFLFTDIHNPTSNKIYQAIGYEPVIDVDQWSLAPRR